MKFLYTTLVFALGPFLCDGLLAQDIQFSYDVSTDGATSTVTFYATNTGSASENLTGFTIDFYYDDDETSVSTVDFSMVSGAPLNWETANETVVNHQPLDNPLVPITHTGYFVYQNFDNNFAGLDMAAGEEITLGSVVFDNADNIPNEGGEGFIETTTEQPGLEYFGEDFVGHPLFTNGVQQQALPVTLKSFSTEKHTESSTIVRWTSSSEINASHYEVERSTDQVNWAFAGNVSAVGNSSVEQSYDLIDRDLNLNSREDKKIYYYRLKMVDLDGAYEYSHVDAVSFDAIKVSGMFVYPNPTVQDVFVTLENADNAVLRVSDRNGKVVLTQKVVTGQDERVVLSNLPSGVYMLSLIQNDEVQTQQVIKMN